MVQGMFFGLLTRTYFNLPKLCSKIPSQHHLPSAVGLPAKCADVCHLKRPRSLLGKGGAQRRPQRFFSPLFIRHGFMLSKTAWYTVHIWCYTGEMNYKSRKQDKSL